MEDTNVVIDKNVIQHNTPTKVSKITSTLSHLKKYKMLYIIAIPGILYFLIFKYIPLVGSIIAFKDYNIFKGVFDSPWAGLKHFRTLFENPESMRILKNTLLLSFYDMLMFPAPLILALLLNELRLVFYKKIVQTVIYMPHFLSWVIISGIFVGILSPTTGIVNHFIEWLGKEPIYFLGSENFIRPILIFAQLWQSVGWGTIIYLAALTAISPELYEAAKVDGANRWKQTIHVTIPSIMPTFTVLFLLQIGNFLDFGFERVYVFLNPLNSVNGEVLDTYIFKAGLQQAQYSFTTAIGLLKSVVGLILLMIANFLSKRFTGNSLY
ncbi:putative aldouronate transport system permease protein [Neobacillus niacini]|uniref:ABC transporter permease n=1 Tax=Neobacillus niacini TaxID=86668 RepID=UPI0010487161|nr:ABC transporter permease subunit [Neobacillus niacini]MDR7078462.1 putative aldouronate transport system permease protein [Neobacillus niacini]